jgi:hypothetical protein
VIEVAAERDSHSASHALNASICGKGARETASMVTSRCAMNDSAVEVIGEIRAAWAACSHSDQMKW